MKQNISKEQWDELSEEEKNKIIDDGSNYLSIGQLIEFLGDDLFQIDKHDNLWYIYTRLLQYDDDNYSVAEKELIDALWEATKYKLKQ